MDQRKYVLAGAPPTACAAEATFTARRRIFSRHSAGSIDLLTTDSRKAV